MKKSILSLIPTLLLSYQVLAVIPVTEVRIANTARAKDDYIGANYVQCSIRMLNGASFPDNVPVLLRNIPLITGGQVLFSKSTATAGTETLALPVRKNNGFSNFYIKAKPGF